MALNSSNNFREFVEWLDCLTLLAQHYRLPIRKVTNSQIRGLFELELTPRETILLLRETFRARKRAEKVRKRTLEARDND
jgi:hypothetical protein